MNPAPLGNSAHKISTQLRTARLQRKDLSQRKIAELVAQNRIPGFSAARLSRLELGYADASWAEVTAIAAALGVGAEWLAGVARNPAPTAAVAPIAVAAPAVVSSTANPQADGGGANPPERIPERSGVADVVYRRTLIAELERANARLADRGLPPAAWQRWRTHLKLIQQALAELPS